MSTPNSAQVSTKPHSHHQVVNISDLSDSPKSLFANFDIMGAKGDASKKTDTTQSASGGGVLRFLFCAGGIFVCYFFYGILQERM